MREALILFVSTFGSVFALGFQSQNVNQGHYWSAAITSLVIGGSTMWLYRYMPGADVLGTVAYLAGGVTGIVASMWVHRRTLGRIRKSGKVRAPRPWPEPPHDTH